jgi:hypothetical protein
MKKAPEKPLESKRDHAVEKHMAITRRATRMAGIRQKRDDGVLSQELFQVSQALILCGLPYQPTKERHFTRKARLGDGSTVSVTFSTALEASMPYGSDRTLLHFLMDRAVKTNSRFVSWETATEFLNTMNLATGGKNRRDLRERFRRIAGLTIGVERKTADTYSGRIMPVIGEYHLPTSIDVRAESAGAAMLPLTDKIVYGVEIDEKFFKDLLAHHVPIPAEIIRATRKQSQLQDLVVFLYWRCYAAESTSLIKWEYLRQQVWQDDKKERRIRERFAEAIVCLKTLWPEVTAEALPGGLIIGKPRAGRYMLVEATSTRRL